MLPERKANRDLHARTDSPTDGTKVRIPNAFTHRAGGELHHKTIHSHNKCPRKIPGLAHKCRQWSYNILRYPQKAPALPAWITIMVNKHGAWHVRWHNPLHQRAQIFWWWCQCTRNPVKISTMRHARLRCIPAWTETLTRIVEWHTIAITRLFPLYQKSSIDFFST